MNFISKFILRFGIVKEEPKIAWLQGETGLTIPFWKNQIDSRIGILRREHVLFYIVTESHIQGHVLKETIATDGVQK